MDLSVWHLLIFALLLAMGGAYARLWLQRRETVKILTSKLMRRKRPDIPIERAIIIQPGVLRGFIFLMRWITRPEFARLDLKRFFAGFYDDEEMDLDPRAPLQPGARVNPHFLGVVYIRMIHRNVVALADPHLIKQVMITMGSKFPKAKQYETLKLVLGNGLVTSGGAIWRRQRALLSKVFTPSNIEKMADSMTTLTLCMVRDEMDRIAESGDDKSAVLPFDEVISNLTLRIVTTAVFGSRPDFIERMSVLWRDVMSRIMVIALMNLTISDKFSYLPIRVVREFNASVDALKKLAKSMIDEYDRTLDQQQQQQQQDPEGKQSLPDDTYELLRLMLTVQDEEGNGMDRKLLLDEALTFLFAGHDTTSSWLSSVFWKLAERKDVQCKAQEAVDRAFADLENDELPTVGHLDKMEYLRHVLHETLRLDPPVKIVFKLATETVEVGDIVIPKGSEVFVSIESLHRNPKYWTDRPDEFIPERWTEENLKLQFGDKYKSMLRQCFIPFSTGTRNCIGKYFTQQEAMIIASMILHRFDVEFESEEAAKKAYVHAGPVAHARNLSLRFTRRNKERAVKEQ